MIRGIFKGSKGMSIIEVVLALAVLSIIAVPLITTFGNSLRLTKHVDKQIDINAFSRLAIERVKEALANGTALPDEDGNFGPGVEINIRDLISSVDSDGSIPANQLKSTDKIGILDSYNELVEGYYVIVSYCKDFHDTGYKIRYILIEIKNKDDGANANEIKLAVDAMGLSD